jgi:hypothetical protein
MKLLFLLDYILLLILIPTTLAQITIDCSKETIGPLPAQITDISCKIDDNLNITRLLDSTWTDKSLQNGTAPNGIRSHVDWRYKYGDRPLKRKDDSKFWMGFNVNTRQCGGTCKSAAFFHQIEFSRMIQTLTPHVHSSWKYGYANRKSLNIRHSFRVMGMPEDKKNDTLANADCRYIIQGAIPNSYISLCPKSSVDNNNIINDDVNIYDFFRDTYGNMCKSNSTDWWNTMSLKGLNGVQSLPNTNVYRGNIPYNYYFKKLGVYQAIDGTYRTNPWLVSDNFNGYSENAILMFLVDTYGPINFSYRTGGNTDTYNKNVAKFYKNGTYNGSRIEYGSDMLISKELPGQPANIVLLNSGNYIIKPSRGHTQLIVGYRYIHESPKSSYWIMLNSHGETSEHGFEYFHMTIGVKSSSVMDMWLPSLYWNKFSYPIRAIRNMKNLTCDSKINCQYDNQFKRCLCV